VPLGFWNVALNVGLSAGAILPFGRDFTKLSTSVPDRFFLGGHSSLVCSLGGPSSLLGFRTRGLGPTDARRVIKSNKDEGLSNPGDVQDFVGGDLAVTAFADLSFDLPLKIFRDAGIHGHAFVCAGNLAKLTEGEIKNISIQRFFSTFRSSAGVGVILPTKFFRVEVCLFN
jgi:outer membrane protein insertion porin family